MKSKKTEFAVGWPVALGKKYFAIESTGLVGTTNWTVASGIGILLFMGRRIPRGEN